MFTEEIRETMRLNAYVLVEHLMQEGQSFRLIIWNHNDWDKELPEVIMEDYPVHLVLDIEKKSLESSFIDELGMIHIVVRFNEDTEYIKVLDPYDIFGILTIDGEVMLINNFEPEYVEEYSHPLIRTNDDIVALLSTIGLQEENIKKSMKAFLKDN